MDLELEDVVTLYTALSCFRDWSHVHHCTVLQRLEKVRQRQTKIDDESLRSSGGSQEVTLATKGRPQTREDGNSNDK